MTIYFRYSEHKFEKPSRCQFKTDFTEKVVDVPCGCHKELAPRVKRHLITLPWGKRYFGYERCAPEDYLPARTASPSELRRFYRSNCCKENDQCSKSE